MRSAFFINNKLMLGIAAKIIAGWVVLIAAVNFVAAVIRAVLFDTASEKKSIEGH